MKKTKTIVAIMTLVLTITVPAAAMAQPKAVAQDTTAPQEITASVMEVPTLASISFKNATINQPFDSYRTQYTVTLDNPEMTPTLNEYKINGDANIFVTYNTDDTKHQTGIIATLEYYGGTTVYTFDYANAEHYSINSENRLADVDCYLGEGYPAINDKDTDYKLFIPSDMDSIRLTAVTKDINAYCDAPDEIALSSDQEPTIMLTVTASDSGTRTYKFKVKRLKQNCQQVEAEINQPGFKSLVEGRLYYQQPIFFIAIISVMAGIILLTLMVLLAKRLTVKPDDEEEPIFFHRE